MGSGRCTPTRLPTLLAWAGGKQKLVKVLCQYIPPHEVYVEPFAGGAALFWAKEPAKVNVLSDIDCRLIRFYETVRGLSSLEELTKFGWAPDRARFEELRECIKREPYCTDDPLFLAYALLYVNKFGYGAKVGYPTYNPTKEKRCSGKELCQIEKAAGRFPEIRERLKKAILICADFRQVIPKFDSPSTFFFVDPPYWRPEHKGSNPAHYAETGVSPTEVAGALRGIRGKFLVTYNDHPDVRAAFQGFRTVPVEGREEMGRFVPTTGERRGPRPFPQLLIMNYDLGGHG